MKFVFPTFRIALRLMFKDKFSFMLSMVPLLVGLSIYTYVGTVIYTDMFRYGKSFIQGHITSESVGMILSYVLIAILTIVLFFLINWTFVLTVSIISSPFNDALSARVEKNFLNQKTLDTSTTMKNIFSHFFSTILNEIKKVSFIVFMTIIAALLGLSTFLAPFAFILTCILLAISYLDYTWSRHNLSFQNCVSEVRKNFLSYFVSGAIFFILINIPLLNLLVLPYSVIYYTVLRSSNIENSNSFTR